MSGEKKQTDLEQAQAEVADLRLKVSLLYQTEARLYKTQNELDKQLKIFRQLHDFGIRASQNFDLDRIGGAAAEFATRELRYQRSLVLVQYPPGGGLTVRGSDGYGVEQLRGPLARGTVFDCDRLRRALESKQRILRCAEFPHPDLDEFAARIDIDDFVAFPMLTTDSRLMGVLLAGSTASEKANYWPVTNEVSLFGLGNLSTQCSALINATISHESMVDEEAQRRVLEKEIDVARTVQASILPAPGEKQNGSVRLCGALITATQCSGDFWTFAPLRDGRLLVAVADATGHGVGSAMFTELAFGALQTLLRTLDNLTPAKVLSELNAVLWSQHSPMWMSMAVGIASADARHWTWANAGHPPPLLCRQGTPFDELPNIVAHQLGAEQGTVYTDAEIHLDGPWRILLYSDGLSEMCRPNGKQFGFRRLGKALETTAFEPRLIVESLKGEVERFMAGDPVQDDVTIVALTGIPS